jgi:hypothetical protein
MNEFELDFELYSLMHYYVLSTKYLSKFDKLVS